jgi:hypothetical protein
MSDPTESPQPKADSAMKAAPDTLVAVANDSSAAAAVAAAKPREIGGPSGPEPTRYGDWERAGRCIDF